MEQPLHRKFPQICHLLHFWLPSRQELSGTSFVNTLKSFKTFRQTGGTSCYESTSAPPIWSHGKESSSCAHSLLLLSGWVGIAWANHRRLQFHCVWQVSTNCYGGPALLLLGSQQRNEIKTQSWKRNGTQIVAWSYLSEKSPKWEWGWAFL